MGKLEVLIQKLEARTNNVLAKYKQQYTVIQKLKIENQALKQKIDHLNKIAHNHPSNWGINSDKQREDLAQHIDHYIQDIEHSIEQLQSWKS